jgi:hypothetical protein
LAARAGRDGAVARTCSPDSRKVHKGNDLIERTRKRSAVRRSSRASTTARRKTAWRGSNYAASRLAYPWRRGSSLARECVHVNAHRRAAANRWTWCQAMTEGWRLRAAEVDKGGAPCGGDAILRTEEHGRERLAQRWFGRARMRASGREARSRPARRKTRGAQQRSGGAQRRRGITRASA